MFSALKRLTTRSENGAANGAAPPPGLHAMSSSLQKKFSKGVHYNMKIILKGDRNSGKTCLFRRLQGLPFIDTYTPTEEIQAANIQWNYKATDDVVKVEVWDVVDKAKKKKALPNKLKIDNSDGKQGEQEDVQEFGLDASFLDVYKNTNGVIIVFDITKAWTFDYVKKEIASVPKHIPVLILGNHRDMGHHRAVASDTVQYFIEGLDRDEDAAEVRYAESSMRNGFGLKYIHKFFNLPFLQLQRETLYKQLQTNQEETGVTLRELDFYVESDESNYDLFIEGLTQKRRQAADAVAPPKLSLAEAKAIAQQKAVRDGNLDAAKSIAGNPSLAPKAPEPTSNGPTAQKTLQAAAELAPVARESLKNEIGATNGHRGQNGATATAHDENHSPRSSPVHVVSNAVDDFMPDDAVQYDKSFYDDFKPSKINDLALDSTDDEGSSSKVPEAEEEDDNPMVAAYEEDIEPEVYSVPAAKPTNHKTDDSSNANHLGSGDSPSKDSAKFRIVSSSEDEDAEDTASVQSSKPAQPVLDFTNLDMGYFEKLEPPSTVEELPRSASASGASDKSSSKSKKKSKKSTKEKEESSSKKHKKSKKKSSRKEKDDLEDFLNSGAAGDAPDDQDAYEAI